MYCCCTYAGNCTLGPETQCFDAFGVSSSDSVTISDGDNCDDYISDEDAVLYISLSAFGGMLTGVFVTVIFMYLLVGSGNNSNTGSSKADTFSPMSARCNVH